MNSENPRRLELLGDRFVDFLHDESRLAGFAEYIAFPETEDDVADILRQCAERQLAVTVQGARTGITAGAVPHGGVVLNMSKMNRVVGVIEGENAGEIRLRVQPGLLLKDLREYIRRGEWKAACRGSASSRDYFFPPDPTETTASLGGMIACNASGALSFHYGPTRNYVMALRVVLADGRRLALRRGVHRATGRRFTLSCEDGTEIRGTVPSYRMPRVKNAAGYFAQDDMDLLDLFVGGEGTLGVVTEAELVLQPAPIVRWGVMGFLDREGEVAALVELFRRAAPQPVALEYFDRYALDLLRQSRDRVAALQSLPEWSSTWQGALYVEFHAQDEGEALEALESAAERFESFGIADAATWTATDAQQMEKLREMRHAVPEQVNAQIASLRQSEPRLTKLGTDMAVPDEYLAAALRMYREGLDSEKLYGVQFGHIGDNHVHVNILPRTWDEYERGRNLYLDWARRVIQWGGTISAEHGVGKLKVALLREMYGVTGVAQMAAVKRAFDPEWRLGCGTLFEEAHLT